MRSFTLHVVGWLFAAGCGFSVASQPGDAAPDTGVSDAGPCTGPSASCAADVLRTCADDRSEVVETPCPWGCEASTSAHCRVLMPSGGAVTGTDLDTTGLVDLVLSATTIDSTDGEIVGVRPPGAGVMAGIDYEVRGEIAVFRVNSLRIAGPIKLRGSRAIAIVASGAILVDDLIDGRGDPLCTLNGRTAGPGGFTGGDKEQTAPGSGGGTGSVVDDNGGGGGGHCAVGGPGSVAAGIVSAGGPAFGTAAILQLVGGGGGGGGGGAANAGLGAGGGPALQLVSNTTIAISAMGGINAGGCGGDEGTGGSDAGGGGGAGGTILLEAPTITIAGKLAVNGGGGGTHNGIGVPGTLDRVPAAGGTPSNVIEGQGGIGGAGGTLAGGSATGTFGGGGGSIGRMRFHTRSGSATVEVGAMLSPAITDSPTCTTESPATAE